MLGNLIGTNMKVIANLVSNLSTLEVIRVQIKQFGIVKSFRV